MRWVLLALVGIVAGCGPDCLSTCQRLHGDATLSDGSQQCRILRPGTQSSDMIRECVASCEGAMARAGELGGYDPTIRTPPSEASILSNDRQAAAWMDCVNATACEDLNDGYCAPTLNYSNDANASGG